MTESSPQNPLTMNQELYLRNLELNLEKASRKQLIQTCLDFAEQVFHRENAAKEMYYNLAIKGVLGNGDH